MSYIYICQKYTDRIGIGMGGRTEVALGGKMLNRLLCQYRYDASQISKNGVCVHLTKRLSPKALMGM